jgi:hypothetical protein
VFEQRSTEILAETEEGEEVSMFSIPIDRWAGFDPRTTLVGIVLEHNDPSVTSALQLMDPELRAKARAVLESQDADTKSDPPATLDEVFVAAFPNATRLTAATDAERPAALTDLERVKIADNVWLIEAPSLKRN